MTVELICVGTELLLGNIVNTNAAFLAEQCAALGLSCYYQTVVGDNPERLLQTVRTAFSRSDIILLSGGLGPTKDDLTKETVAEVFGAALLEDTASREMCMDAIAYMKDQFPKEAGLWQTATGRRRGLSWKKKDGMSYCCPDRPMS